ncbi:WYL domain-containing protein [Pseudomonas fontis]|uniref:WYL domain-containing protein n=1 Tax=Pseudomonas fontis TaxID=2942633 RepID=A0ABT5NU78_9PSED|nr:WYL domain-containing protein [Pseudomonas fontis]MDD0972969.1 WYL domain-containing protein [Pseudomonas fontis]MDD0991699.1 WYL domain-containing protein [Pseudomonas fontis]
MPSATTRATLSRQWELLRQLPSRSPGVTSAQLVMRLKDAGFPISKRSIERDLNELSLIFPLERNDKSIPYGWHWSTAFAAHRSPLLEMLGSSSEGLREFELSSCLQHELPPFGHPEKIELIAWVNEHLARLLRETPLSADMRLMALEQGHQLTATVSNSWQLRWWLLSQGDGLIVEQPVALREHIALTLISAAAQYQA